MEENEEWLPVEGYEGLYEVSDLGRVRSLKSGKILKPQKNRYGYLYVCLGDHHNKARIHRLVAEAFISNTDNLPVVNHKNFDRADCRVENLEWTSIAYNIQYSHNIAIEQVDFDGNVVKRWESAREAERQGGFLHSAVCECCKKKRPHYKGYFWRYAP